MRWLGFLISAGVGFVTQGPAFDSPSISPQPADREPEPVGTGLNHEARLLGPSGSVWLPLQETCCVRR